MCIFVSETQKLNQFDAFINYQTHKYTRPITLAAFSICLTLISIVWLAKSPTTTKATSD